MTELLYKVITIEIYETEFQRSFVQYFWKTVYISE